MSRLQHQSGMSSSCYYPIRLRCAVDPGERGDFAKAVIWFYLLIGVPLHFLPSIIAMVRKRQVASVIVINFFLGWTVIGWVGSLALAVSAGNRDTPPPAVGIAYYPPPPAIPGPPGDPSWYQQPGPYGPPAQHPIPDSGGQRTPQQLPEGPPPQGWQPPPPSGPHSRLPDPGGPSGPYPQP